MTSPESIQDQASPSYWAGLGARLATKTAETWCAEWKRHDFECEVWELPAAKMDPELAAATQDILAPLWERDDSTEYYRLKDALQDGWRETLGRKLRAKRNSLSADDVGLSTDDTRIDRPPRYLLLADGMTIEGHLSRESGALAFGFRVSWRKELTIALPDGAEFMAKPSEARRAPTARLMLRSQGDGYRHWLGRRDVHCGYGITLALPSGQHVAGRYECNLSRGDCLPTFHFRIAGGIEGVERVLHLPEDAEFVLEGRAL